MKRASLTILVADDSYEDRVLLRRAFSKCENEGITLQMTNSGNEACEMPEVDQAGVQMQTSNTGKLGQRFLN